MVTLFSSKKSSLSLRNGETKETFLILSHLPPVTETENYRRRNRSTAPLSRELPRQVLIRRTVVSAHPI